MQIFNNHKEWFYSALAGLIIAVAAIVFALKPTSTELAQGYSASLEKVRPYVVSIYTNTSSSTVTNKLLDDPLVSKYINITPQTSLGSGILLGHEGFVVTNAHVLEHASSIIVQTLDGQQAPATQYWIDSETDIALLKTPINIQPQLPLSSMEQVKVGDLAFTIGNPFGVGQSVSMGIISATGRKQPSLTQLTDFIQTDAAINPGNSGGALVNSLGEVIGMNSAILSSTGGTQGIGFAIPIHYVLQRVEQLKQQPIANKGFVGIDVTENHIQGKSSNIEIVSVLPNGPADLAGLIPGDIISTIDNNRFDSRQQIIDYIQRQPNESVVQFKVIRKEELVTINVMVTTK